MEGKEYKEDEIPSPMYHWDKLKDEDMLIMEYPSGYKATLINFDGITIPVENATFGFMPDCRTNLPRIKSMTCRDDDVLICAHHKAGTHWVWELIKMLRKGKAEYEPLRKTSEMLELHTPEEFDEMQSPRTLNTHLLFRQIPDDLKRRKCKIIFLQRNPKDIAVSLYNHTKNFFKADKSTWEDLLATFCKSTTAMFCWYDYTLQWETDLAENSGQTCYNLFYEELKKDPISEIKKLTQYLELDVSDQLITDIADKCQIKNMKAADRDKPDMGFLTSEVLNNLYRKGEVGDWKNWFTVAQNERFDAEYKVKMKNSKLSFIYE